MRDGATHYTAASGIREVREKTAAYVTRHTGVPTRFENIVLTPGSKNLLLFALLSLVEEGDEVIVPDPGYPIYRSLVEFIGAKAVSLPLRQENDFRADVDELARLITPRTRMLVVNSPQNPTGGILTRSDCEAIARTRHQARPDRAERRDLQPSQLRRRARLAVRDRRHGGADDLHGRSVQSMGNVRLAPRLRLDAGGDRQKDGHADDQQLVVRGGVHAVGCGGGLRCAGVRKPPSDHMVAEFHHRRDRIVDLLNGIPGFVCARPAGAFYVFPDITATGFGDRELAKSLLDEVGVAVLPGRSFGPEGAGHIRLSYAASIENLEEAARRIAQYIGSAVAG